MNYILRSLLIFIITSCLGHTHVQDRGHAQGHALAHGHARGHDRGHGHALSRQCSSPTEVLTEALPHRVFSKCLF